MVYQVSLKKRVLKALEDINEPYYSKIKEAIYSLTDNPRPPNLASSPKVFSS